MTKYSHEENVATAAATFKMQIDEYLKNSFYPYVLLRFLVFFMLNKCPNAINIHLYD